MYVIKVVILSWGQNNQYFSRKKKFDKNKTTEIVCLEKNFISSADIKNIEAIIDVRVTKNKTGKIRLDLLI